MTSDDFGPVDKIYGLCGNDLYYGFVQCPECRASGDENMFCAKPFVIGVVRGVWTLSDTDGEPGAL